MSAVDPLFLAFQEAVVGRFALQRELGRGGMGIVYLAREVRLDRSVAIKLLPPDLAANPTLKDRFMREARTAARLSHPYIVPIHAVDDVAGFVFYVMAFVDGETLSQRVSSRGPLPPSEAMRVLREIAWALSYAHQQGVVHRDIKPANILLERGTGRALVTDFGIARVSHIDGDTAAGEILGTPEYMSPEQASGEPVDARSDIYSLGVVAFYTVSATLPFTGPTTQAVLAKHITQPAPPVSTVARALNRTFADAIDRCLIKNAHERMPSGEAVADALAPNADAVAEVPVAIRSFLDPRKMWSLVAIVLLFLPGAWAWFLASNALTRLMGLAPLWYGGTLGLIVVTPFMPIALAVRWLRPLLRAGYGPADIAQALRARFDRQREEYLFEHGAGTSPRERVLGAIAIGGLTIAAVTWTAMLLGAPYAWLFPVGFVSGVLAPAAGLFSATTARVRAGSGSWWARRWEGVMGRVLTKLASINLGQRTAAADRPTEIAIAYSAQALFDELPKETRRALGDVPAMLDRLEHHARDLRARIGLLDQSIAEAQNARAPSARDRQDALVADLRETRHQAEARLTEVMTTLESTRLDLLRLRAGHGSVESVTQNVAAARSLGDHVNRLLSGFAEVKLALQEGREPTPV